MSFTQSEVRIAPFLISQMRREAVDTAGPPRDSDCSVQTSVPRSLRPPNPRRGQCQGREGPSPLSNPRPALPRSRVLPHHRGPATPPPACFLPEALFVPYSQPPDNPPTPLFHNSTSSSFLALPVTNTIFFPINEAAIASPSSTRNPRSLFAPSRRALPAGVGRGQPGFRSSAGEGGVPWALDPLPLTELVVKGQGSQELQRAPAWRAGACRNA